MKKKQQDIYGEPEIIHSKNFTDRVYHLILTEEERERRLKRIAESAAILLFSAEKTKKARDAESKIDKNN